MKLIWHAVVQVPLISAQTFTDRVSLVVYGFVSIFAYYNQSNRPFRPYLRIQTTIYDAFAPMPLPNVQCFDSDWVPKSDFGCLSMNQNRRRIDFSNSPIRRFHCSPPNRISSYHSSARSQYCWPSSHCPNNCCLSCWNCSCYDCTNRMAVTEH